MTGLLMWGEILDLGGDYWKQRKAENPSDLNVDHQPLEARDSLDLEQRLVHDTVIGRFLTQDYSQLLLHVDGGGQECRRRRGGLPDDKAGNLAKHVPQLGLCNGARGTVYDIAWAPGASLMQDQPCVIMMEFDKYSGPAFLTTTDGREIVPILRRKAHFPGKNCFDGREIHAAVHFDGFISGLNARNDRTQC
ncbi:hypothetical protein NQ176_g2837 [Zarea fungicola]|uniref:Uncharacterized protein n=1 Tax=Zarea fungicola TaxID=93591 RepID=A0ACC1NNW1_9HYPO|nr:hypothetical protein NQ176_g2837 [Lecanicillium fungicola]